MIKNDASSLVQELESRLLPEFKALADALSAKYPTAKFQVLSHPVGSLTYYQGHGIGLSCILADKAATEADLVDLSIEIRHIPTIPEMNAEVVWGYPSGRIEAEYSDDWVAVTDKGIEELIAGLPKLYDEFEKAIKRGRPSQPDDA